MNYPHHGTMNILVDGKPMTFSDFLASHRYVDKEWRKDIEFDLGSHGESEPNDDQRIVANYSTIILAQS